jgi:hypothetical protein
MPAYQVKRSIVINKPIADVKASLIDFRQWPIWSPWLIMEPDSQLNYSDTQSQVGASYNWDGTLVGAGEMVLEEITDQQLAMDLQFKRPFTSTAKVFFDLEKQDQSTTRVTWTMNSHFPFLLFFVAKKIKAHIGMDYERGLKMLKDYLETGTVSSKVEIEGKTKIQEQHFIGLERTCAIADLSQVMRDDFSYLFNYLEEQDMSLTSSPLKIVKSVDPLSKMTSFVCAVPVNQEMEVTPPLIAGFLKEQNGLKITHTGFYEHLGNAWSTAMAYSGNHRIKTRRNPLGYEFYLNDPANTDQSDLLTEVILPIR